MWYVHRPPDVCSFSGGYGVSGASAEADEETEQHDYSQALISRVVLGVTGMPASAIPVLRPCRRSVLTGDTTAASLPLLQTGMADAHLQIPCLLLSF